MTKQKTARADVYKLQQLEWGIKSSQSTEWVLPPVSILGVSEKRITGVYAHGQWLSVVPGSLKRRVGRQDIVSFKTEIFKDYIYLKISDILMVNTKDESDEST